MCIGNTKPAHKDAFKELIPVAYLWENIGTLLGVDKGALKIIKKDYSGDCIDCLREMLSQWLKMVNPQPTWSVLIQALDDLKVDQELMEQIKCKYIIYC